LPNAHAAVTELLPTSPKCTMIWSLLPAPPCAVILPDVESWDAHKIKPGGTSDRQVAVSASSSGGQCPPMDSNSGMGGATLMHWYSWEYLTFLHNNKYI
jgi:hypothetical protein